MIALLVPSTDPVQPVALASGESLQPPTTETNSQGAVPGQPNNAPSQSDILPNPSLEMGKPSIDGNPIQPDFGMPYGGGAVPAGSIPQNIIDSPSDGVSDAPIISESGASGTPTDPPPVISN